jgi:hypothetical protein
MAEESRYGGTGVPGSTTDWRATKAERPAGAAAIVSYEAPSPPGAGR